MRPPLHSTLTLPSPFNVETLEQTSEKGRVWWHWVVPRLSSSGFIAMLLYWIMTEQNGFSNTLPSLSSGGYLGYHALGMSLWTTMMHQETMLAYINPIICTKDERIHRLIHVVFHIIGMLCGIGGLVAILWYKQASTQFTIMGYSFYIPYSTHSWMGIGFLGSWAMQCLGKLCPSIMTDSRYAFLERTVYVLGLTTCSLGIQHMQTRQLSDVSYAVNDTFTNVTSVNTQVSTWWFSKPSLGVVLLAVSGIATLFFTH